MFSRIAAAGAAAVLIALTLSGCGSGTGEPATPAAESDSAPTDPYGMDPGDGEAEEAAGTILQVADTSLGAVVVDDAGMTIYMFDSDTQGAGASTCEGQCAANWPAVTTDGEPAANGVTGELGTITGVDGAMQVTLNGWPLYYFVGDSAPGDVTGQAVNGVWWVLTSDGEPIRE